LLKCNHITVAPVGQDYLVKNVDVSTSAKQELNYVSSPTLHSNMKWCPPFLLALNDFPIIGTDRVNWSILPYKTIQDFLEGTK
jgi:hypothetical protein